MIFVVYLLIGALAGTVSGLLGLGGGIIVVPLLKWIFLSQGMPAKHVMHLATGSSLAAMAFTSLSSYLAHAKYGVEVLSLIRRYLIGIIAGTIIGAVVADLLHSNVLSIIFGVLLLMIGLRILLMNRVGARRDIPGILPTNFIFGGIGTVSGITGVGGGTLTIPFLTYCSVDMRKAVAFATAMSVIIAIVGAISFFLTGFDTPGLPKYHVGYIYWPAVLGIVLVSPIFARIGAAISHRLPVDTLRRIFAGVLLIIGITMLI